jgi:hypothetical protein
MVLPSEDDRDAIDRAFAELVAGYHLTADRPDPRPAETVDEPTVTPAIPDARDSAVNWAADHPLFGVVESPADAHLFPADRTLRLRATAAPAAAGRARLARLDRHRIRGHHRPCSDLRSAVPHLGWLGRGRQLRGRIRHPDDPAPPRATTGRREWSSALGVGRRKAAGE